MKLTDIVQPEAVQSIGDIGSKKRLLRLIADTAAQIHGLNADRVFSALLEREALGPTGVGRGIALPHAHVEGIDKVVGGFIRLDTPVNFDSVDHQPVDLVFYLLAPPDSGVEHLKALALVSRTLRNEALVEKLRRNDSPSALYAILTNPMTGRTQAA